MPANIRGKDEFDSTRIGGKELQAVTKKITAQTYVALAANSVDTLVAPDFFLDIVPIATGSNIRVDVKWVGENHITYDTLWHIHRNDLRINDGVNNQANFGMSLAPTCFVFLLHQTQTH